MARKHTEQHKRFIAEYLIDRNGTRSAIAAGYSPKTAASQACDLLSRPKIAKEIDRREQRKLQRLDLRQENVLEGLRRVAFCDPADLVDDETGDVLPLHEMPVEVRGAIAGFRKSKDGTFHVLLNNRVEALHKLAQHFDLLRPEVSQAPTMTGPVTVNVTEIYLDKLTTEELRVLEKLLLAKQQVDEQMGLTAPSEPKGLAE